MCTKLQRRIVQYLHYNYYSTYIISIYIFSYSFITRSYYIMCFCCCCCNFTPYKSSMGIFCHNNMHKIIIFILTTSTRTHNILCQQTLFAHPSSPCSQFTAKQTKNNMKIIPHTHNTLTLTIKNIKKQKLNLFLFFFLLFIF